MTRLVAFAALATLALGGSAGGATATAGLRGYVKRGPTMPVCRVGVPCTEPAAGVKLFFSRKSKVNLGVHLRIMLRHCPRRYWPISAVLLTVRLLGHVFVKNGLQRGPSE